MGISSALFSGVSGLNTLGNSMSVIGDNIANVNTIGFKSSRSTFETVLAQSISGASGTSQVGRGVALSAVDANFSQGSFESTSEPTDMAIGGAGFFMVSSPDNDNILYTRAGHFRFDEEGFLVNPADLRVQGWELDPTTGEQQGNFEDIRINANQSAPNPTGSIDVAANLDSAAEILETGAAVDSFEHSSSGFVFAGTEADNPYHLFNYDDGAAQTLSIIDNGGLETGKVYSGAEVADALETAITSASGGAISGIEVEYNSSGGDENTFYITNNSTVGSFVLEDSGAIAEALGIPTGGLPITNSGGTGNTDAREYYVKTGVNDVFDITVDGNPTTGEPQTVRINEGQYSGHELASEMETQINLSLTAEGVSVEVRYDETIPTQKVFSITSSSRGTGSEIDLDAGAENFLTTVNIAEYDSVTEGSGLTSGGFTESRGPSENNFLISAGTNTIINVDGNPCDLIANGGLSNNTFYTGDQISAAIETAVETVLGGTTDIDVIYNETTGFFQIQNIGGDINVDWAASNSAQMLGFPTIGAQTIFSSVTLVADNSVNFNIVIGLNDTMTLSVDTETEVPITIDSGSYTGSSLASELEDKINAEFLSSGEEGRVEVSYETDNTFKIESSTLGNDGYVQIAGQAGVSSLVTDVLGIDDFTINNGVGFQVDTPDETSNYSTALSVYDSAGGPHTLSLYFRKASETTNVATWEWFAYVPAGDSLSGEEEAQARGTLTFNNAGILTSQTGPEYLTPEQPDGSQGFDFNRGAPAQQIDDIDFGLVSGTNITTQFRAASSTIFQTQDGYGTGSLQDVAVDPDGVITGNYSNGQVLYLAKLTLARFTNPWGLSREGGNNYARTRASGDALTAAPGINGNGSISPNSLEQSNVDLSREFVDMIIQQRGFQANSKIITTTDQMLSELINLKR